MPDIEPAIPLAVEPQYPLHLRGRRPPGRGHPPPVIEQRMTPVALEFLAPPAHRAHVHAEKGCSLDQMPRRIAARFDVDERTVATDLDRFVTDAAMLGMTAVQERDDRMQ